MSESSRAIFLSYASQDADAAKRICDALHAAGLEAWFDQSELRGGDAWDAAIRKQVKECAFFVPIISANTNARSEGYFRREWNLAVQRMLDMADDQAFLLPVVIDDTPDTAARVPDRFLERQWSRIADAEAARAFAARVLQLASGHARSASMPKNPPVDARAYLSVVVLPFANRTGDAEQEYLADGITESLTMDLSRIRDAFIVSASTAYTYKNKPVVAQQVGRDLGVRFALQGSVQRSGTRLRINAQLADTASNAQIWSEAFEGDLSDLFALQDQVTARIANSIGREIVILAGREAETRKSSPKVADLMLRVRAVAMKALQSLGDFQQVEALCREVLALEPNHAGAMGYLATSLTLQANNSDYELDPDTRERKFVEGREIAARAKELDPENPGIYVAFALYAAAHEDYPGYRRAVETGFSLNSKSPGACNLLAGALLRGGEAQKAIEVLTQAISLDPKHPFAVILDNMGWAYFMLGDNDAAIEWALKCSEINPASPRPYTLLAMAYALNGDDKKARAAMAELHRVNITLPLKSFAPDPSRPAAYKRYFEERLTPAWRKAGLPE